MDDEVEDAESWASRFVARLANDHQSASDANALLSMKRGMIYSEAPYLWDSLRRAINERVGKTNAHVGAEFFRATAAVQGAIEHTVKSDYGYTSLRFDSTVPVINCAFYRTPQDPRHDPKPKHSEFRFEVYGEKVWFVDASGEKKSAAQIAGRLLEMHSKSNQSH